MLVVNGQGYEVHATPETAWLQTNRDFGNMVPVYGEDAMPNRARALSVMAWYTTARSIAWMKPQQTSGFVDLDRVERNSPDEMFKTDGFFTTDPGTILHARPADCGMLAIAGYSAEQGKGVIGLIHTNSVIVGQGGHLQALDYLCKTHDIDPATLTVQLAPAARAESYKFPDIHDEQKTSPAWQGYVSRDGDGLWHVNFHGRMVDEITDFGVCAENIIDGGVDTISDPRFFSWFANAQYGEPMGGNGTFFALRGGLSQVAA